MSSPRHISTNVVSGINGSSITAPSPPPGVHTVGVDSTVPNVMRSVLLTNVPERIGQRPVSHIGALATGADMMYAGSQRLLQQDELGQAAPDRVNVVMDNTYMALANEVVESLFTGTSRKREASVPTPTEFRAALQDMKESIKAKANRQRNEARAETARLQEAISVLVGSRSSFATSAAPQRSVDADSDESGDELGGVNQVNTPRRDWTHGYERK